MGAGARFYPFVLLFAFFRNSSVIFTADTHTCGHTRTRNVQPGTANTLNKHNPKISHELEDGS
jgi:hypothetical protein